jgi:nifR3 family TIM-barrel protein
MLKIGNIELGDFPLFLAPMEDVTDPSYRIICKELGADMLYTEFISSEGLIRDALKSQEKLDFSEEESPVGIQIFGHLEESMVEAARIAEEAEPDLIDINWGCPAKKVVSKCAGSGMLQDVPRLVKITEAVVKSVDLPVTAKTRLGWDENSKPIVDLALRLQDIGIKALTIHGRTRAQLYKGEADWTLIGEIANHPDIHIPIIGNGDITTPQKAVEYKEKYGVDGIMVGRGAIGYPWIFRDIKHYARTGEILPPPDVEERVRVCRRHLQQSLDWKGERRGVNEMRKHYTQYFKGLRDIKPFRMRLVTEDNPENIQMILDEILQHYK